MINDFNVINSPKDDGVFEFHTDIGTQSFKSVQCKHCMIHWQYVKNSGIQRGWCMKCNGILCGKEECMKNCIPYEARIEYTEALGNNHQSNIKKLLSKYPDIKILCGL